MQILLFLSCCIISTVCALSFQEKHTHIKEHFERYGKSRLERELLRTNGLVLVAETFYQLRGDLLQNTLRRVAGSTACEGTRTKELFALKDMADDILFYAAKWGCVQSVDALLAEHCFSLTSLFCSLRCALQSARQLRECFMQKQWPPRLISAIEQSLLHMMSYYNRCSRMLLFHIRKVLYLKRTMRFFTNEQQAQAAALQIARRMHQVTYEEKGSLKSSL